MKKIKVLLASLLCVTIGTSFLTVNVGAKSLSWVPSQMEYRRKLLNDPQIRTYVKTSPDNYVYYGAKFEPRSGIYIGTPYDRKYSGVQNAIDTSYDWFVACDETHNNNVARVEIPEKASDHTKLIGLNWNFALKNSQKIDIRDYSNYIYNKIDEIASWGEDVLLIFGKEMNIDDNFNYPEIFIDCFRFVADYAHTKENIAMVWGPNDTGGLDTTLLEYYPGDEYVDWIGCSLYTMPYFQGNPNADDGANMSFIMGDYANPSMRAKMISAFMQENNIKKPVMITEGGVGFESPSGIDYTGWAKHQLRMYYADIARRYPEFKCIISFNQYVQGDLYRYDMGNSAELNPLFEEVTADEVFLKNYPSSSPYAYTEITDGMEFSGKIELSSYAYIPKKQNLVVRYLVDGAWVSEKSEPPYSIVLDNSLLSYGDHTLTCEIYDGNSISRRKSYKIRYNPSWDSNIYADVADNGDCPFADMTGKPAQMKNAVALLAKNGIVNGVDGNTFAPDSRVSRAELAAMLMRLVQIEESDTPCGLTDVTPDNWYYKIINTAVVNGLIDGYEDNTFRGGNAVTKNEFTAIVARILMNICGKPIPETALTYGDTPVAWAVDYIKVAKANGILLERTDGIFNGDELISRGDAAIMMANLFDAMNK